MVNRCKRLKDCDLAEQLFYMLAQELYANAGDWASNNEGVEMSNKVLEFARAVSVLSHKYAVEIAGDLNEVKA